MSAADYNALRAKKRPKYGNVRTEVDGIRFDSAAEARRYGDLKLMQQAGEIADLHLQPRFPLTINGRLICHYVGDFDYIDRRTGERVIEDVKSTATRTAVYRLKRAMMHACHGIEITEVEA